MASHMKMQTYLASSRPKYNNASASAIGNCLRLWFGAYCEQEEEKEGVVQYDHDEFESHKW